MQDTAKYLIHADIRASGVVERSDVVGAIYGQTEGLLGDELDLRTLQDSSKVGRIDVDVESEGGRTFGTLTVASGLDRVETAILAAALETIERVGPSRAEISVAGLEDVRSAKRADVVDRATELLSDFEAETLSSRDIVEAVRERVRVEDVTTFEGLPAGPRVADSDAIVVVEGRADVITLLQYGVKNAIAVEGTDVPDALASLTADRTVTTFLDGDRGGDLILQELAQVGSVDYVAVAPDGRSVEDLSREQVLTALRRKVPYSEVRDADSPGAALRESLAAAPDDGTGPGSEAAETAATRADAGPDTAGSSVEATGGAASDGAGGVPPGTDAPQTTETATGEPTAEPEPRRQPSSDGTGDAAATEETAPAPETADSQPGEADRPAADSGPDSGGDTGTGTVGDASTAAPETLASHVAAAMAADETRLLDADFALLDSGPAEESFDLLEAVEATPTTVVVAAPVSQRLLDLAAQRGVEQVVGDGSGEFVKQPTDVRVRTAAEFDGDAADASGERPAETEPS